MPRPVDRQALDALFEGAPRFVDRLAREQPTTWDDLFERAERIALTMPEGEQVELLNAHPRIGAPPASVSPLSYREQGYDRDPGTAELQRRLGALNDEYERRLGFRCVVFVDGRSRAEIADVIAQLISAPAAAERERGLRDVIAIARSRGARVREDARR